MIARLPARPDGRSCRASWRVSAGVAVIAAALWGAGLSAQTDPSVAKARAAKVDTSVFSLQFGDGLRLPTCDLFEISAAPMATCLADTAVNDFATSLLGSLNIDLGALDLGVVDPLKTFTHTIRLARANCPAWVSDCTAYATLEDGRLVAIYVNPDGRQVEQVVGKELQGKYGRWSSAQERFITPNNGGAEFRVLDLEWDLPGLHVDYRVVHDTVLKGLLRIELESSYARRRAKEQENAKPKL